MNFSAWIQAVLRGWMESSRNSWLTHMLTFLNACNIGKRANKFATSAISVGLLIESRVKRSCLWIGFCFLWVSQVVLVVKNSPDNVGDIRDVGSLPGWRLSPRGGRGNPLQYSCLENHMDRETSQATVPRVTKNQTWLKQLSRHAKPLYYSCVRQFLAHINRRGLINILLNE